MAKDFFEKKRPWSKYKDLILGYYLEPYLPKVDKLRKPILIVDCFAGPGQFKDGSPGSPLIICRAIKKWSDKGVRVSGIFIEADDALFSRLQSSLQQYGPLAKPRLGTFELQLPELAALAKSNSVFLYVDPYSVDNLRFAEMRRVYEQIQKAAASVEVLMNFNAAIFMRWGLAALKRRAENTNFDFLIDFPKDDDDEFVGVPDDLMNGPEITALNAIAGGDYWQEIALDPADTFSGKLERFMTEYQKLMSSSFKWVGSCAIKSRIDDHVPKYYLVYATRSHHGIELMNEAMCKARSEFLKNELPLFSQDTPFEEFDIQKLCADVVALAKERTVFTRGELRLEGMKQFFGMYAAKDYNRAVKALLEGTRLFSKTGKHRINDEVPLSKIPFG